MGGGDGGRTIRQHTRVLVAAAGAATASLLFVFVVGVTLSPRGQSLQVELDSTSGLPSGWHKDVDSNGRFYPFPRIPLYYRPTIPLSQSSSSLTPSLPWHCCFALLSCLQN